MTPASERDFQPLVRDYLEDSFHFSPVHATQLGVHRYDDRLGERDRAAIDGRVRQLHGWLERLAGLASRERRPELVEGLTVAQRREVTILDASANAELLAMEEQRTWATDPTAVLSLVGSAFHSLIARNFSPLEERLKAATARAAQVPAFLDAARRTLERPARVATEAALEQLQASVPLFSQELPLAFAGVSDLGLLGRFHEENGRAMAALADFGAFLQEELMPRSDGDFRLGPGLLRDFLRYHDYVERPVAELVAQGQEELRKTQEQLRQVAAQIDPTKSIAEVVEAVSRDHPTAAELVPEAAACLEELRQFCIDHQIVSLPTEVRIEARETPSFMRFFGFAYSSSPGPFETVATEAYYYLTPSDPTWSPDRTESYLRFFNRAFLPIISLHETYPGHYVHIPWMHKASTLGAKVFPTATAVEGWAHYCEEMMLEQGYGAGEPRLRLVQLQAALLRLCRYLVALRLHSQEMTYQEAVEFFVREGYNEHIVAEREVRRGALNPNFYAYTLGKLEILRLREEVRARWGSAFRLQEFHDRFVQEALPIALIREQLLEKSPP